MSGNRTIRYFSARIKKTPQLSFREKKILLGRLRHRTLSNIGKKFGVTEARIRQIEKAAIVKFKRRFYQQKLFN